MHSDVMSVQYALNTVVLTLTNSMEMALYYRIHFHHVQKQQTHITKITNALGFDEG